MIPRRRRDEPAAPLGFFIRKQSGRVCARVFIRFRDIADVRAIVRQVPDIAHKTQTTEDDVWHCLYYYLRGFGEAARA